MTYLTAAPDVHELVQCLLHWLAPVERWLDETLPDNDAHRLAVDAAVTALTAYAIEHGIEA
jgi:hypothetical protein